MARRGPPKAHNDEFRVALIGVHNSARQFGLDRSTIEMNAFLTNTAERLAHEAATQRWLSNMVHAYPFKEAAKNV